MGKHDYHMGIPWGSHGDCIGIKSKLARKPIDNTRNSIYITLLVNKINSHWPQMAAKASHLQLLQWLHPR
jgi:hypothetical protein